MENGKNIVETITSKKCWVCSKKTKEWILCSEHSPKYGDVLEIERGTIPFQTLYYIFCGGVKLKNLKYFFGGTTLVKWWYGTDALTLIWRPPGYSKFEIWLHKKKFKLINWIFDEHWVNSERLIPPLLLFGIPLKKIKICDHPPFHQDKVKKRDHSGFNVLFYYPPGTTYNRWVYGIDIYEDVRDKINGVNWILAYNMTNMEELYSVTDFYLRLNRHDGRSMMIDECKINKIPYYYSEKGLPDASDAIRAIEKAKKRS